MVGKKARLIVTYDCNKNCDGCCNKNWKYAPARKIQSLVELREFDEIMITGGEPMLYPEKLADLLTELGLKTDAKLYLYTAYPYPESSFLILLSLLDGVTITIHNEQDSKRFLDSSILGSYLSTKLMRLNTFVDGYENIDKVWKVKRVEWIKDCPLPIGEELLILNKLFTHETNTK
jgi:organic radical activating enzyme